MTQKIVTNHRKANMQNVLKLWMGQWEKNRLLTKKIDSSYRWAHFKTNRPII